MPGGLAPREGHVETRGSAAQQGYDYPTVFFKYQRGQANNIINDWAQQVLDSKISPELGHKQMQDEVNALQQAGASEQAGLAAATRQFPSQGPVMAAVQPGI